MKSIMLPKKLLVITTAGILAGGMSAAHGFDFNIGELNASFDSDIGWALSQRTQKPDSNNLGVYGNRHLFQDKWDIFSNAIKGSHTLEVKGDSFGGLVRGNWFYDFEMANQNLPDAARNRAKQHGDITDAYVYKRICSMINRCRFDSASRSFHGARTPSLVAPSTTSIRSIFPSCARPGPT